MWSKLESIFLNMKARIFYTIMMICILAIGGCTDDFQSDGSLQPSLSPYYLSVSTIEFNRYNASAFSDSFEVESYRTPWKFSSVANWITLSPQSGSSSASIQMNVEENFSATSARTAIFYLESAVPDWSYSKAISVSQTKGNPMLSVETDYVSFSGSASEKEISIEANCEWSASTTSSWISLEEKVEAGKLTIKVASNPYEIERIGYIQLVYGSYQSYQIKVAQAPASVSASDLSLTFDNVASLYNIIIDSETEWSAAASESWIQVSPDHGNSGKTEVTIEVAPNSSIIERYGSVEIKTGTTVRLQISVLQKGLYVEAVSRIDFPSSPSSQTLQITSNTEWEVLSYPDWLTLSQTSGNGNGEIIVTTLDNPNTSFRNGDIEIGRTGTIMKTLVHVHQAGKYLGADERVYEFSDKGGEMTFNLQSDAEWSSSKSADWFSATPESGKGDAVITLKVEENTTDEERIGTIEYHFADSSTSFQVHQLAKYMTIDNKTFEFESKGGKHIIELATNDAWTAEIEGDASWLKLSETAGTGDANITLTAEDNATLKSRSAVVVINTKNSQSVRIIVSQKPRYLSISTESIMFFAKGGTSELISIDTDGTYDISSDASWFTVNKNNDNTFTVTATKNGSPEVRRGTITITMTDLSEGSLSLEIAVIQAGDGGSFIINGYPADKDWNYNGDNNIIISINGYGSDKNWDEERKETITVTIEGYEIDKNWDDPFGSTMTVKITGFSSDKDWN